MRWLPWILFGVVSLVLVGWVGYSLNNQAPASAPLPSPVATTVPTSGSQLQTYVSPNPRYQFNYPGDLEVQHHGDGTLTLVKWGPTQQEGTEFYDGISLNFKTGQLNGATLKEFVDQRAAELGGVFETSPPASASVGTLSGYRFHVKGYVEGEYYYVDLGTNSYLEIIDATKDPSNAGFASIVSGVLASLTQ